jgi:hypothetical protein
MGAVFPLTGFTEIPNAESVSQQSIQPPAQQLTQSQLTIPPELIPKLQHIRAMRARFVAAGGVLGQPLTGNPGDLPGSTPQPGTVNPAQQQPQIPSGINLEMMQALTQRRQDG